MIAAVSDGSSAAHALGPLVAGSLAPEGLELVEAHQHRIHELTDSPRVDHDDLLEVRKVAAHFECLVELFLVLGDQDHRFGMAQEELDLGRRARGVETDRHRTDALDSGIGQQPLVAVRGLDRDTLPGPNAELHETEPDVGRAAGVLVPRDLTPDPELLLAECRRLRMRSGVVEQQRRKGGPRASRLTGRGRCRRRRGAHDSCPRYASITFSSFWTSSGEPVAISRPKSIAITRSAMSITRCMSCSTMIWVIPSSLRISRM